METKILVITKEKGNLTDALQYFFRQEKIEYQILTPISKIEKENFTDIIYLSPNDMYNISTLIKMDIPMIIIDSKKRMIENEKTVVNYIVTSLVNDKNHYTEVQKEYLFKKGIYNIFIQKIKELLKNVNNYNNIIYDLTEIKIAPNQWIFNFESINETYAWLSRKNQSLPKNFTRKIVVFAITPLFITT